MTRAKSRSRDLLTRGLQSETLPHWQGHGDGTAQDDADFGDDFTLFVGTFCRPARSDNAGRGASRAAHRSEGRDDIRQQIIRHRVLRAGAQDRSPRAPPGSDLSWLELSGSEFGAGMQCALRTGIPPERYGDRAPHALHVARIACALNFCTTCILSKVRESTAARRSCARDRGCDIASPSITISGYALSVFRIYRIRRMRSSLRHAHSRRIHLTRPNFCGMRSACMERAAPELVCIP